MPSTLRPTYSVSLSSRTLLLGNETVLMGILNVTPDSFSERGMYFDRKAAIAHGLEMEREGAAIIDVGGESTRPGATPVSTEEELDRTIPVIEGMRRKHVKSIISIDTYKAEVAERALSAGAEIVNDISGLRFDARLATVAANARAAVVLMHTRGTPRNMQTLSPVRDVNAAVIQGISVSLRRARAAGINNRRIILDPGIGFGKTADQNFQILSAGLRRLRRLGYPILAGPSRKSFIRRTLEQSSLPRCTAAKASGVCEQDLLLGTAAAVVAAVLGGAHILRVHDVRQMLPVVRMADHLLASTGQRSRAALK